MRIDRPAGTASPARRSIRIRLWEIEPPRVLQGLYQNEELHFGLKRR